MEGVAVLLGIYSFLTSLLVWMFYLSDKDMREHGQKLINENKELKEENEKLNHKINYVERNSISNISNQLDRMNNLLELEIKYNREFERLFE